MKKALKKLLYIMNLFNIFFKLFNILYPSLNFFDLITLDENENQNEKKNFSGINRNSLYIALLKILYPCRQLLYFYIAYKIGGESPNTLIILSIIEVIDKATVDLLDEWNENKIAEEFEKIKANNNIISENTEENKNINIENIENSNNNNEKKDDVEENSN